MIIRYDPDFIERLKKQNVRIRKSFKERILIFSKDPFYPQLNNHPLREEWEGYRSVDITNDYRAIYIEKVEGEDKVAYFVAIGIHEELFPSR